MRLSCVIFAAVMLLLIPVHTGCQGLGRYIVNTVYPKGSSHEPGISKQERRARFEQENINAAKGMPWSSENR